MKKNKILLTILTSILLLAGCDSSSSIDSGLSSFSDDSSSITSTSESSNSSSDSNSSSSSTTNASSSGDSSSFSSSSSSSSTSSGSSTGEINPDIPTSVKYDIQYDLGGRTTAVQLKNAEDIYDTFYTVSTSNIIESVEGFEYIYGGGNGGSGATKWYTSDVLKFGTTSFFGSLTLKLNQDVKGVKISGYVHKAATTISVGDVSSSMWNDGGVSDKKITNVTLSDLNVVSLDVVNNKDIKTMEVTFDNTRNLKIAITKNGPLYLTSIEFITTVVKKYDVTWKNYDGTILQIDNDVPSGETPKYNGVTPTKDIGDGNEYIFAGWTPSVGPIKEDTVYTARFVLKGEAIRPSGDPIKNGQYIEYGYYPQNHVKDNNLLNILDSLPLDLNGWTLYDGKYYVKTKSNIYNNETYNFDGGTSIKNETNYWFECETIKWNILSSQDNEYLLVSNLLLESMHFYKDCSDRTINSNTVLPNSYEYSDIRSYLNNDFLNKAFFLNNTHLIQNSSSFNDKISLLSKDDCLNQNYGFSSSLNLDSNRTCKVSEYARSSGSWMNKDNNNGSYWTKTSSNDFSYACYNINSGGVLSEYAVDSASHSIRPVIIISL